ncbi:hypothetical protein QEN19_002266 [Hanseniaspora menglaensis]
MVAEVNTDILKKISTSATENEVEVKATKAAVLKEDQKGKKKKKKVSKDEDDYLETEASYVGWKQVGGYENKDELTIEDSLDETHEQTFLNRILPEAAYGDWYHSVALFGIASIFSFIVGKFKFSLGPLFIVISLFSLYYRTSIKKHRASIKELVQKEIVVKKVEDDYESTEWLNTLLDKFWPRIEPQVSQMVVEQVNEVLATPGTIPVPFVKKLWIDEFTLGVKPPRIESVKTFGNTANDVVVMDWKITFTPHDNTDLTSKQLKNYVNNKVIVKAFIGQKFFAIPVASISDIAFSIPIRLRFKLMTAFPHMQTVNVQLLDVPEVDFEAKLLNNSILGWDLPWFIPGFLPFLNSMIKTYAGPILMPPFSFQLNIPQLLQGDDIVSSIGVLEVTLRKATDIKRSSKLDTSVDPFVNFSFGSALGGDNIIATSRTVRDTLNPVWDETIFLIVDNLTDPLIFDVMDLNEGKKMKNMKLGRVLFDMNTLFESADESSSASKDIHKQAINAPIMRNAKPIGSLLFDLKFHSVVEKSIVSDASEETLVEDDDHFEELNTGVASFIIDEGELTFTYDKEQANNEEEEDSDCDCELGDESANKKHEDKRAKTLNLFVEIYKNGKLFHTSNTSKGTQYPKYGSSERFIVDNKVKTKFKIVVKNGTDKKNTIIGSTVQSLSELIDRTSINNTSIFMTIKDKNTQISEMSLNIRAGWKSINLYSNSSNAASISYQPPIGVIRTFINKARELKDVETIGTIDPYASVHLNGKFVGRTGTVDNSVNPIWNQAIYAPVNSSNQKLTLEVHDTQASGKDKSIGFSHIKLDESLITKEPNSDKWSQKVITDPKDVSLVSRPKAKSAFRSKKKSKTKSAMKKRGYVTYYESFYPCLPILSLEEIQEVNALNQRAAEFQEKYGHIDLDKGISDKEERAAIKSEKSEINELQDLYSSKLKLDLDELLSYNSGVLSITFLSGELAVPNSYIQTFFDESGYSRCTSNQFKSRAIKNPYIFDEFIKELEWSVTTFRVVKKAENNKAEEFVSELVIPTMEIVKNCYYKPGILTLTGSGTSKLMIQAEWFPVLSSKLPQSDLITNYGDLKVTVKNATNVPISDLNGFSDPYVKLYVNEGVRDSDNSAKSLIKKNGDSFFKTKTIKKNLNPVWNETGSVKLKNRVNDYLYLKLYDSDLGSGDDLLGIATFPLSHIDPDNPSGKEFAIEMLDPDSGENTGAVVNLTFEFEPKYVLSVHKRETNIATKGLTTGLTTVGTAVGSVGKLKKGLFGKK